MFFPIDIQDYNILKSLPVEVPKLEGVHRGVAFRMERRTYGQTLARMVARSQKTGRTYHISIGLAWSEQYDRPELRVDFVKRFHPELGRRGKWISPFDPMNPAHVAVIQWAYEAFLLAVHRWIPQPSAQPDVQLEQETEPSNLRVHFHPAECLTTTGTISDLKASAVVQHGIVLS